jgi:hypothetical protein
MICAQIRRISSLIQITAFYFHGDPGVIQEEQIAGNSQDVAKVTHSLTHWRVAPKEEKKKRFPKLTVVLFVRSLVCLPDGIIELF